MLCAISIIAKQQFTEISALSRLLRITFSSRTYHQHSRCSALIHHVLSLNTTVFYINSSCTRTTFIIQYLSNFSEKNYCLCDQILVSK